MEAPSFDFDVTLGSENSKLLDSLPMLKVWDSEAFHSQPFGASIFTETICGSAIVGYAVSQDLHGQQAPWHTCLTQRLFCAHYCHFWMPRTAAPGLQPDPKPCKSARF